jgi:hypothetical protein
MDPISIISLTAAIQQLLSCVYNYGQGVREAKKEINQLCSELLALKAALEHVQLNLGLNRSIELGDAQSILSSSNFATPEFQSMVSSTDTLLKELLARLDLKSSRFKSSLQRLAWPLFRDDVKLYTERLERTKSWFVLATTSDSMYALLRITFSHCHP